MPRLVAFLRAINVGGHTVRMADLRGLFESLGFTGVETVIASGNVVFTSRSNGGPGLARRIEARLEQALGYEVRTFIRTTAEVAAIAGYAPFREAPPAGAGSLIVGFLAEPLAAGPTRALVKLRYDGSDLHVHGREIYWLCRTRQSDSTVSNALLEKTLQVRATFRNVKTVARIAAGYAGP